MFDAEQLAGLEMADRAPAPAEPYAVSHWTVTHCPGAGRERCGALLVTRGLVTTCPRSMSHYTRVVVDEGLGRAEPNSALVRAIPTWRERA